MFSGIIGSIMVVVGLGVILYGFFMSWLSTYGTKSFTLISVIGLGIGIPLIYFGVKKMNAPNQNY